MSNLSVSYLGLNLKNPLIVGSCGLTNSIDSIKKLAENGAGAIVLKSLFEEQITVQANLQVASNQYDYPESIDYIKNYSQSHDIGQYLTLIEKSKKETSIPIIASINCVSNGNWTSFAKDVEKAGADAIELNIAILPSNLKKTGEENETVYFSILEKIHPLVKIPVSLKMSNNSSGLSNLIQKIDWTGNTKGFVLFNRHYAPDIDIENMKMISAPVFSSNSDYSETLRWVALLSDKIKADISATTGTWDGQTVIKQLLAGAKTVQLASVLYKNGPEFISQIIKDIETWMKNKGFSSIEDFRGKMSMEKIANPTTYERIQFMKYFSAIE